MIETKEQRFQNFAAHLRTLKAVHPYNEERFIRLRNGGIHTWSQDDEFIDWCIKHGYEDVLEKEESK
ncbi:hypothetical protein [Furfurilactobacillus entadae]|uniref:hypothetical protein n=1 Tax=Furfurilactobacillus entadae TaxID=2922307 RepID=UPI0035F03324